VTTGRAVDIASLVRIVKRKLKKIQYRPHLIAKTSLTLEPWWSHGHCEFNLVKADPMP
jgi:hypothetical protein